MLFHFFYIDLKKYANKRYILGMIIITVGELLNIAYGQWNAMIGILIINSVFLLLALDLKDQINSYTKVSIFSYFMRSGFLGATGISLAYSIMILGAYTTFPLSCTQINNSSDTIIEAVAKPFNRGLDKIKETKIIIQQGLQSTMGDIVQTSKTITLQNAAPSESILGKIIQRKNDIINNTIKEQTLLNQNICEYTLTTINAKLASPTIQTPIIIILAIFVFPWLKILIYIINAI